MDYDLTLHEPTELQDARRDPASRPPQHSHVGSGMGAIVDHAGPDDGSRQYLSAQHALSNTAIASASTFSPASSSTSMALPEGLIHDSVKMRADTSMRRPSHPRPPPTPSTSHPSHVPPNMNNPLLPSAPASPPTPAPSPTPLQRASVWNRSSSGLEFDEDTILRDFRLVFRRLDVGAKEAWLAEIVDSCDNHLLSFVHHLVSPRLKKDPFATLPNELCFKILEFVDDPRTFVRASQVSRRWREILSDDQAWKALCEKHAYRRMSIDSGTSSSPFSTTNFNFLEPLPLSSDGPSEGSIAPPPTVEHSREHSFLRAAEHVRNLKRPRPRSTHRSHFKHRYLVESAWRKGGQMTARHIQPDQGVVTSLHLTKKYIVVALDNAKIHIFNTRGDHQRTLNGHVMGVWAMVPWGDTLVSGGCDRDVRVWNMATGASIHTLRGHTSTVRCLKMSEANTAISGSRDTTLRIWDIATGTSRATLQGHQASVRCLEIYGDYVVSGSYDTTAKIWRISTGQCLRTLQGHFSQIYAIAFDGVRIATGSLDTSVRIWDPHDGSCKAILQGHTSLVGQLQMRGSTLVTGGSDGSVRVWSLETNSPIHRLAAHDNSVTSLQFDDARIVSGGSDGRVKIWDRRAGTLIRELSQPAEAVWRVAFEEERSVVLAQRHGRTVMEVWDFSPPPDDDGEWSRPISRELSGHGLSRDMSGQVRSRPLSGQSGDAQVRSRPPSGLSASQPPPVPAVSPEPDRRNLDLPPSSIDEDVVMEDIQRVSARVSMLDGFAADRPEGNSVLSSSNTTEGTASQTTDGVSSGNVTALDAAIVPRTNSADSRGPGQGFRDSVESQVGDEIPGRRGEGDGSGGRADGDIEDMSDL